MRRTEFSPALELVMRRAAWQARGMGHSYVGTEHLLLALLREEAAGRVLRALGWEEGGLRGVLLLQGGRGDVSLPLVQGLSPSARRAVHTAAREAAMLRSGAVLPEHLLLALTRQEECTAAVLKLSCIAQARTLITRKLRRTLQILLLPQTTRTRRPLQKNLGT